MKKGFTLVELMATIIILSVIMLIGVGAYKQINKKIREQQYNNKVTYIENQAALYGSETGYIETTVSELVETGYVEADDEEGNVVDPREPKNEEKYLNDCIVEIRKKGENYYGHLLGKKFNEETEALDRTNKKLEIIVTEENSDNIIESDEWTNQDVTLTYNIIGAKKGETPTSVIWFDNVNSLQGKEEKSINVSASTFLNTEYRVEVLFEDGTKYEAKRTVKIDKQPPVIYDESIKVDKADEWTSEAKQVTILASDQNGSGIAGYYVSKRSTCPDVNNSDWKDAGKDNPEIYKTELDEGRHYICAKDKAGNVTGTNASSDPNSLPFIEIDKIDTTVPECNIEVYGETARDKELPCMEGYCNWYVSNVYFNVVPTNEEKVLSGIVQTITPATITSDGKTTVKGKIISGAGKIGECEAIVNVDKTPPTCTWLGEAKKSESGFICIGENWAKERTIESNCTDNASGCKSDQDYSISYSAENYPNVLTKTASIDSVKVFDNVGLSTTCPTSVNVCLDHEPPRLFSEIKTCKSGECKEAYDSKWTTLNVQAEVSASDGWGVGLKTFKYTTGGAVGSSTTSCSLNGVCARKITKEGESTITYSACDNFNNCNTLIYSTKIDKSHPTVSCSVVKDSTTLAKHCNSGYNSEIYCTYIDEGSGIGYRESVLVRDGTGEQGMGAICANLENQSYFSGEPEGMRHDTLCGYPAGNSTITIYGLCDKLNHCVDVTVEYNSSNDSTKVSYKNTTNSCPKD